MCGINGFSTLKSGSKTENEARLRIMNSKIFHRGPDESGIYADGHAAIGMTRLSIIDLSSGKQPIKDESGRWQIVFNGEIYNYKSIRIDLEKKGYKFRTTTDTETILYSYIEYGEKCLKQLKGMFAFAIYDTVEQTFFIARDRAGEKPLYYAKTENEFVFASELKSIIAIGCLEKEINREALSQYLALTYIPAPLTILKNVYKLPAAHYMRVTKELDISIHQYWDVVYDKSQQLEDYAECKKVLRSTMYKAVEDCMVADVPIGAFLSGGVDSTIIAGIMADISPTPINTFTIGFKDKSYDESPLAEITAKKIGSYHHVHYIDYGDMLSNLDSILANIDEPFADSSLLATYIVSKLAREDVKVVLTGDSGDELFGGYERYLIGYYSSLYNKIPKFARKNILERIIYSIPDKTSLSRKIRKVVANANKDTQTQRVDMLRLGIQQSELDKLLRYDSGDFLRFIGECYQTYSSVASELDCTLYMEFKTVLEGEMLCKVDRASMLASLETRVPMLYPDVIELAARIPSKYKISNRDKKIILKDTFSDLISEELLNAPKHGFSVPMADWLRNELREDMQLTLDRDVIEEQQLFNYEYIKELMEEHFSAQKDNSGILWALYVFEKWYGNYMMKTDGITKQPVEIDGGVQLKGSLGKFFESEHLRFSSTKSTNDFLNLEGEI